MNESVWSNMQSREWLWCMATLPHLTAFVKISSAIILGKIKLLIELRSWCLLALPGMWRVKLSFPTSLFLQKCEVWDLGEGLVVNLAPRPWFYATFSSSWSAPYSHLSSCCWYKKALLLIHKKTKTFSFVKKKKTGVIGGRGKTKEYLFFVKPA